MDKDQVVDMLFKASGLLSAVADYCDQRELVRNHATTARDLDTDILVLAYDLEEDSE